MNNKSWKRGIGWYLAAVLTSVAVLTGCENAVGQNAKKEAVVLLVTHTEMWELRMMES